MSKLEHLTPGTYARGVAPNQVVTVIAVEWYGSDTLNLVYRMADGKTAGGCSPEDELQLQVTTSGCSCRLDADGARFLLGL